MSSPASSLPSSRSGLVTRTHPGRCLDESVPRIAALVEDKKKWCERWGLQYKAERDEYIVFHDGVKYLLCFRFHKTNKEIKGILVEKSYVKDHMKKIRQSRWEIIGIDDDITLDDGSFDKTPWTSFKFISK
jgi:hypothetical protein